MLDYLFIPILALSALIHGALGFGMPLLATPLLAVYLPMPQLIPLTLIPVITTNLVMIATEKHWREALCSHWPLPVGTAVGSLVGTQIMLATDPDPLRFALGLVLVAYLVTKSLHGEGPVRRVPPWGMALAGFSMGLMAGLVNIFAPLVVVFALVTRLDARLMVSVFNLGFVTSKAGQLVSLIAGQGIAVVGPSLLLSLVALPFSLAALWVGIRVRRRVDRALYLRWLEASLWLIALLLLVSGW